MFSVDTSFTSFTGLSSEGEYFIVSVASELSRGVDELDLRSSTTAFLSLTLISLEGIVVSESIPFVIVHTGVVVAICYINKTNITSQNQTYMENTSSSFTTHILFFATEKLKTTI